MKNYDEYKKDETSYFLITDERKSSNFICKPIIICILLFELCERFTFYSINANFVRFCTLYLEVDNVTALNLSLIFTGLIYIICIFMGWLSDSILGKFHTIVFSGIVYVGGVGLITLVTFEFKSYFNGNIYLSIIDQRVLSTFGLIMIIIGTGGIKTSVGPFGAQQLLNSDENVTRSFFIWFYWFINLGAALAYTIGAYTQQNINFFYGYLIPTCAIFISLILFIAPQRYYQYNAKIENNLGKYFGIIWEALRRRSRSIYKYNNLMDYASLTNGGSYDDNFIEGLKKINRIIPVMLTFIPFNIAYFQMQSTYLLQSERLNLTLSDKFVLPVASLNLVNNAVILFIIPVLAVIVYPIIQKFCGKPPNPLQRIGFGLFLCAISVIAAGVLEIARKRNLALYGGGPQTVFGNVYNISSISIFYQIPQFFFVGAGEVFASTTGLEFAYSQAPVSMQSIITGLYYLTLGIGSFSGMIIILIVNSYQKYQWVPSDIDQGHYEYFFFLLAGIIFVDIIIFGFIARNYKYTSDVKEKSHSVTYNKDTDILTDSLLT